MYTTHNDSKRRLVKKFKYTGNKKIGYKHMSTEECLYLACKDIQGESNGIVKKDGRLVAFWCDYHNQIKAGFGALSYERDIIPTV
jgi:hypothetical protein